jgi:PAS domain S-box-containing protein
MSEKIRVSGESWSELMPPPESLPRQVEPIAIGADPTLLKEALATAARRAEDQAALYQFTDSLYRATSLEDIYSAAFDAIARALHCYRASILLFDETGVMRFVAWRGLSDDYRKAVEGHTPWKPGEADPQPICLEDVDAADLPQSLRDVVKLERIEALAFIPLVTRRGLIGKFMTYYEAPHAFQQDELSLAITIARQLGFGIEHMRAEEVHEAAAAIIASSDDAIVTKNLNGIIRSWNKAAERLFGYTAEEAIGRHITLLIPLDRRSEEDTIIEQIRRGQRVDHYETVRQHKDGSLIDISLTISPIKNAQGRIIGASKIARDITERKRAEAQIVTLAREAEHRAKNILANVQATVRLSNADTTEGLKRSIEGRIQALANVHRLFVQTRWGGVDLCTLIKEELSPYCEQGEERALISGPALLLEPDMAQAVTVTLHELTTNAAKYGALSVPEGRVQVEWSRAPDGRVVLRWAETGGPPVKPPTRHGFGMRVVDSMICKHLKGELKVDWRAGGLTCEMTLGVVQAAQ